MTNASRQTRKPRRRMIATGLFTAAVLLIAAACSSSEDTTDDPSTTATPASSTTQAPPASAATETPSAPASTTPTTAVVPEDTNEEIAPEGSSVEEGLGDAPETTIPAEPADSSADSSSGSSSNSIITRVSLTSFDECDALMEYIRSEALERVGPYGLDDDFEGPFIARGQELASAAADVAPSADFADAAPTAESAQSSAPEQGVDFSGTNVQVEGVDEADIVKTDGRRIIGIGSGRSGDSEIWIADITRSTPRLQGRLALQDGYYQELYLVGDRVFAIGTSTVGIDPPGGGGVFGDEANSGTNSESDSTGNQTDSEAAIESESAISADIVSSVAPRSYDNAVVVTEVDISDPGSPQVVRHLRVEGRYISSRAANGYARVVISSPPEKLGFVQPTYGSESSEASAERFNRLLVQESTLEQWLPNYNLHAANGESVSRGQLLDCDRVYAPSVFSGFNQVSVLSFATGESLRLRDAVSTMASGETVYASTGNLYVSRVEYDYEADSRWGAPKTVVHKFSLDSSGSADYEASGTAIGLPINQYAFHEYQGRLFVATTSGNWEDSESFVTVLEDDGSGALTQVGQVGNLGRNEDIYAVRYIADKAYVVTFRQTDPLYVIDLSDPTDPTTEGELKITGYSAYLHPVGENLLLGVGREATDTGRVTGAKVSLFDVSDPADPRTLDTLVLEGGSSEVEWDARAFLWWAPEELAVVPISDWENNFTGAIALIVDTDSADPKITMRTRISHDINQESDEDSWGYDWDKQITRSMIINDDLWTLSRSYLQANDLETLDRRAWLDIPG